MRKKHALVSWTRRQRGRLFLIMVLALLAVGGVQPFVSSNNVSTQGTPVTLASSAGERDGPPQPGNEG